MLDSCGVYRAIEHVADASGKEKEHVIRGYMAHPLFCDVLRYSLDPFRTYGIQMMPEPAPGPRNQAFDPRTFNLLEQLAQRKLTGSAAQDAIARELGRLTPESAELLNRIIRRDLRAGIGASTVNKVSPNFVYVFKCMLAHPFDMKRVDDWPVGVEPKYDGVRVLAIYNDGRVQLFSRTGKEFTNFPDIATVLENIVKNNPHVPNNGSFVFDGEIMTGEFRQTVGDIHRKDAIIRDAVFYCFDLIPFMEFSGKARPSPKLVYRNRRKILERLIHPDSHGIVRLPPVRYCYHYDEVMDYYEEVRSEGGEGVIVKPLEAFYEAKRSYNWMKIKDQQSADLKIVGFQEGTGKFENSLGALVVDFNGVSVNVGSGLTDADRETIWKNQSDYLGQIAEVEYHEPTPDGSLRHPRFVRIRHDKTEECGIGC